MARLRILCAALLLVLALLGQTAQAQTPMRIAILPVQDETGGWFDPECGRELYAALQQELHIPLNGTLGIAEYLDPLAAQAELRRQLDLAATGKKKKVDYKVVSQNLAQALEADLVVYLRVKTYWQMIHHSFEHGMMVENAVDLRLEGYDGRHGRLLHDTATRYVRDDYGVGLDVSDQAKDALDELLRRAELNKIIFPLNK